MTAAEGTAGRSSAISTLVPLALGQFIASYACSNMNVAVSSIAHDLGTTVIGVQTAITLFTLTMAALMIPGSKLTDIWGRRACFRLGLAVYGLGGLVAAFAPGLGALIVGYSLLEGVGSALMIPPIYILITVVATDLTARARAFGVVSGAAGVGAAAGPLIGGLITTLISWRASFGLQVLVVGAILLLSRRISEPALAARRPAFDGGGAVLSAAGLFFVVLGILQSGAFRWLSVGAGGLLLAGFLLHVRSRERHGREPLLSTRLFRSRTANLGLVTQCIQWLTLQGAFFVISVFLQTVRHHSAIETGLMLSPAILGILLSSAAAGRLARRRSQRFLVRSGFAVTVTGMVLLWLLSAPDAGVASLFPGLLLMGLGIGVMLTASVTIVQSSFPERDQGEISGLSRSVSNLGSSLGTAIVGSVLVTAATIGTGSYTLALLVMAAIALLGLVAALMLPAESGEGAGREDVAA